MVKYEPKRAAFFAEFAEALRIETMDIFAATSKEFGREFVFYTQDDEVYMAVLKRGEDGILEPDGDPILQPNFLEEMKAGIEAKLREELGPPDPASLGIDMTKEGWFTEYKRKTSEEEE